MNRKEQLANIYIKIYNKRSLTMEDLTFLSKYDPECFAKTCQNLVYNIPETKELMEPGRKPEQKSDRKTEQRSDQSPDWKSGWKPEQETEQSLEQRSERKPEQETEQSLEQRSDRKPEQETEQKSDQPAIEESEQSKVEFLLKNLKELEMKEFPVKEISAESVRDLLGSLYMEMLFPHNDRTRYFEMEDEQEEPTFNKKA